MAKFSINQKRCINHYKNSNCDLCKIACPQQAILPEKGYISVEYCNGCGICYAVCPNYAIDHSIDLLAILETYQNKPQLHLQCSRKNHNSRLPCLGILPAKIWFVLAKQHAVTVDLSACLSCNQQITEFLQLLLAKVNAQLPGRAKIQLQTIAVTEASPELDRRNFLKQLVGASVLFIDEVQKANQEEFCQTCNLDMYFKKNLSSENTNCNSLLQSCKVTESCNGCGLCVRLCPHESLYMKRKETSATLYFSEILCSGCKVCTENCPEKAIEIHQGNHSVATFEIPLPKCKSCGEIFQPIDNATICLSCNSKTKILK